MLGLSQLWGAILTKRPASAGITQVQAKSMTTTAWGATHNFTFDSTVTPGNAILVWKVVAESASPVVSCRTNTGVDLTLAGTYIRAGFETMLCYALPVAGSGVTGVTMILSSQDEGYVYGIELAGANGADLIEAVGTGTNPFETGPHNDVTVTTAADGAAVFKFIRTSSRTVASVDAGAAYLVDSGAALQRLVYQLDSGVAGAKSPAVTYTAASDSAMLVIAVNRA